MYYISLHYTTLHCISPHVRESMKVGIPDLGSGFRIPTFRIPTFWIPESIYTMVDSVFQQPKFAGFQILLHGATALVYGTPQQTTVH